MQDYYELLQVHPKADEEAIRAAYERLRERYDPQRLSGAADELVVLARSRREAIEQAYAVLSDHARRANYDADLHTVGANGNGSGGGAMNRAPAARAPASETEELDYSSLPPARGQERPKQFDAQPRLRANKPAGRRARPDAPQPAWFWPTIVGAALVTLISLITLLATTLGRPEVTGTAPAPPVATAQAALDPQAIAPTPALQDLVNQFEAAIPPIRQVAEQAGNNPDAWIELGNIIYNSVQVVRENMPDSALYRERLPRWLEASQAYEKALSFQPDNVAVRADLAVSLCNYGAGVNDQNYVQRGLQEAERATSAGPQNPRALLNQGVCMVSAEPAQTARAVENWRIVAGQADTEPGLASEAQRLIRLYSQ